MQNTFLESIKFFMAILFGERWVKCKKTFTWTRKEENIFSDGKVDRAKANVKQPEGGLVGWRCFSFAFAKDSQRALPTCVFLFVCKG